MRTFPRSLLVVLLLVAAGLVAGGAWYYRTERERVRTAAEAQLSAVASLKVRELTRWRADQRVVASQLVQDPMFINCLKNWLADRSAAAGQKLRDCARGAQENFGYNDLLLVDPAGEPLATLGGQPGRLDPEDLQALKLALRSRQPVLANLHLNLNNEAPQIAVIAPVFADDGSQAAPLGAVVLEQNLSRILYPLIQSWPIPSRSAETLLVEREGDSVLFLNELRHRAGTALKLRLPLSAVRVPAVFAANGGRGVFYGQDYRGEPVISVVEPVPDSPWIMLAKVDEAEVFADWRARFLLLTDLLVTAMGLAAVLVFFVWQRNQKAHFRALYHAEVARRADEERHRTTLTSIGDAVVTTDAQGRVEMLNPAAEKLTGWTLAEARGRPAAEVIRIRSEETGRPVEDLVAQVLREGTVIGLANHALLVTRAGREVPVSDSAAPIRGGEDHAVHGVVVVLTDQTRQRAAQRALRESEQRFRNIFDESPVGYQSLGPDGRILDVNPAWLRLVDRPRAEVVGRRLDEFMTPASAAEFPGRFARFMERGEVHDREFDLFGKDGAVVNLIFDGVFVRDAEGRPHHTHCVMHNLTAFKQAEAAARRDRERLVLIISSVQGIVWELDPATFLFNYVSPQAEAMLGYPVADWTRPGFWADHLHPDDRERSLAFCTAQTEAGRDHAFEYRMRAADGRWVWLHDIVTVVREDGRPARLRGIMTDITARKESEAALAVREAQLRLIADHAPVCLAQIGADRRYKFVNQSYANLLGRPPAELIGQTVCEVLGETHYALMRGPLEKVLAGVPVEFDFERPAASGGPRVVHAHYVPERDDSGRVIGFLAAVSDITERKQMEEALRDSEQRWQFALEGASEGVWDWELTTGRLYCSPGLVALLGCEPGDFTGRIEDLGSRLHPDDREPFQAEKNRYFSGTAPSFQHEHRLRHKDGNYRWILARGKIVERGPGGEPVRMIGTHTDITERRRSVEQLRLLDTALQAVPDGITITDVQGTIEWVNPGFCQMTGYRPDEVLGANHRILKSGRHSGEFYAALWTKILRGEVWSGELINRRKDGTTYPDRMMIAPITHESSGITHFIAIRQDTTAQKQLERQFLRSQRMEGIGQLAGGIAHDLNNLLTPVLLCVEMLRLTLVTDEAKHLLEIIENSARRGAGVVRQVLTFARGVEGELKPLHPQDLVRELVGIIAETFPRDITIRPVVAADTPMVRGDATQLHQVLLNLAVNARDEMPAGGTLTVSAGRVTLPQRRQTALGEIPPGEYAVLKVGDTGAGIPPENHYRIFEPFFTTKPQGKGTGLGLPTAYGIIRSHGGFFELESAVGAGAEFRVYLPAVPAAAAEPAEPAAMPVLAGGGRTLLVCDDEPLICNVAEAVLTRHGFVVLKAASGREALDLLARRGGTVAAALLDIMMPQMAGDRVAEELWRTTPALPVLFMSGLMDGNLLKDRSKLPPAARVDFLRKPFGEAQLLLAMARLLSMRAPRG